MTNTKTYQLITCLGLLLCCQAILAAPQIARATATVTATVLSSVAVHYTETASQAGLVISPPDLATSPQNENAISDIDAENTSGITLYFN